MSRLQKWRQDNYVVSTAATKDLFTNRYGKWSEEDLQYVAAFYETDDKATLALSLGRTRSAVTQKYMTMKAEGTLEQYKKAYWGD